MATNYYAILTELTAAENDLDQIYAAAMRLHRRRGLTEATRARVHAERDAVFGAQQRTYAALTATITAGLPGGGLIATQVPEPVKRADLPPANA